MNQTLIIANLLEVLEVIRDVSNGSLQTSGNVLKEIEATASKAILNAQKDIQTVDEENFTFTIEKG